MSTPRNPAVKRIMREMRELTELKSPDFAAVPLPDNMFEWHFTIRGPPDTAFHGGRYHGRILLPADYPFKPPDIMLLTPSGRFETGKKICLSISGFHPEHWQPSWSIRTVLVALVAFMPTNPHGAIGSLDYGEYEQRDFARKSKRWTCEQCGIKNSKLLTGDDLDDISSHGSASVSEITSELSSSDIDNANALQTDDFKEDLAIQTPLSSSQSPTSPQTSTTTTTTMTSSSLPPLSSPTNNADIMWTLFIVGLVLSIIALLIKKAYF